MDRTPADTEQTYSGVLTAQEHAATSDIVGQGACNDGASGRLVLNLLLECQAPAAFSSESRLLTMIDCATVQDMRAIPLNIKADEPNCISLYL